MGKQKNAVMVLLSGGIDSTACLNFYIEEGYELSALFIDFGQKANINEFNSAKKIADYFKIPCSKMNLSFNKINFTTGEIICRNSFLIMAALISNPKFKGIISLGIHSGTPYYDCSQSFIDTMNGLVAGYRNGEVLIDAPFIKWNKSMIFQYCLDKHLPVDLTYSCENGINPPCGKCLSCRDRRALDVNTGINIKA